MKVLKPPPTTKVSRAGTPVMAPASRRLEKLSFPAPSAGNGGLLMAADLEEFSKAVTEKLKANGTENTDIGRSNSAVLAGSKLRGFGRGGFYEVDVARELDILGSLGTHGQLILVECSFWLSGQRGEGQKAAKGGGGPSECLWMGWSTCRGRLVLRPGNAGVTRPGFLLPRNLPTAMEHRMLRRVPTVFAWQNVGCKVRTAPSRGQLGPRRSSPPCRPRPPTGGEPTIDRVFGGGNGRN